MKHSNKAHLADFALIVVTLIWGLGFVISKGLVAELGPLSLIIYRFSVASVTMGLAFFPRGRRMSRRVLAGGLFVGLLLFLGFFLQTLGLCYTTASNAGFITGLSVVMVPFLSTTVLRRPPSAASVAGVGLAGLGLGLLVIKPGTSAVLGIGDILVFISAVFFALHIVYVGKYAPYVDVGLFVVLQLLTVVAASAFILGVLWTLGHVWPGLNPMMWAPFTGWIGIPRDARVWAGIIYLGALATGGAFFIQNAAQRFTTPTHVAVIFSMEPVFAALFANLFLREFLTPRAYAGALLILIGTLACEMEGTERTGEEKETEEIRDEVR